MTDAGCRVAPFPLQAAQTMHNTCAGGTAEDATEASLSFLLNEAGGAHHHRAHSGVYVCPGEWRVLEEWDGLSYSWIFSE